MAANETDPITRGQAWLVVGAVTATLSCAAYIYALQSQVARKAENHSVIALRSEMRDIKNLLCNTHDNRERIECRRSHADYREGDE